MIARHLKPLLTMAARARDPQASPSLRALFAAVVDGGGHALRDDVEAAFKLLTREERSELWANVLKVGTLDLFCPMLLKPAALSWIAALDGAWRGQPAPPPPEPCIALIAAPADAPPVAAGFRRINNWWLRVDLIERVAQHGPAARLAAVEKRRAQLAAAKAAPTQPESDPPEPVIAEDVAAEMAKPAPQPGTKRRRDPRVDAGFRIDPEFARSVGLFDRKSGRP